MATYRYYDADGTPTGYDRLASPLLAPDLTGLPPALVVTAESDPIPMGGELDAGWDAVRRWPDTCAGSSTELSDPTVPRVATV